MRWNKRDINRVFRTLTNPKFRHDDDDYNSPLHMRNGCVTVVTFHALPAKPVLLTFYNPGIVATAKCSLICCMPYIVAQILALMPRYVGRSQAYGTNAKGCKIVVAQK